MLAPLTGAERAARGTAEERRSSGVQSVFGIVAFAYLRKSALSKILIYKCNFCNGIVLVSVRTYTACS